MKRHISFPSIEKFSNIVTNINRENNFVGLDENGDAIYDLTKAKPVITFKGTVKLHGTNAGVCYNSIDGLWAQSRENIITTTSDNAGFAFFVEANKENFKKLVADVVDRIDLDISKNTVSIYGEWAGASIQKGVAICNLEKSFFIFGVKISPFEVEGAEKQPVAYWVDSFYLSVPEARIYNVEDYKTYSIDIDFNVPQLSQNKLIEMTIEVEDECPIGKAFGFSGIGEGIVFTYMTPEGKSYKFKSKGEKHSAKSKVNTLKPVDDAKINKCIEVANKVTPAWRLEQMLEKQFDFMNGGEMDVKKMGEFLKLVMVDVLKEEMDVLTEAGVEPKDVGKYVSDIAKKYFFSRQNQEAGLN